MTKRQLIDIVARKAHLTKRAADEAVETFLSEVVRQLQKGERVVLSGFGTFHVIHMKSKKVTVPKTGIEHQVPAHR
ncbi:HU family DNA-binding protein, partial [Candidatus Microgenomates bacterium]|nr:HU family DNA-binding protein [Candidatus Microgenomates bacterium]